MLVWEIGGDVGFFGSSSAARRNDRLTDDPTFFVRYRLQSRTGRAPSLAHELHIKVLKPPEVEQLREPLCPDPDVRRTPPSCPLSFIVSESHHPFLLADSHPPPPSQSSQDHHDPPSVPLIPSPSERKRRRSVPDRRWSRGEPRGRSRYRVERTQGAQRFVLP